MKKATDIMSKTGKWLLVFGFIFSQISFPIEVLAEELTTNENAYVEETNNEVVEENTDSDILEEEAVINIEDATEYTVTDVTTVVLELQGEEFERIDFSNKLYGTYSYKFTLEGEEKVITFHYEGNNTDLLEEYKLVTQDSTKNISYEDDKCIISGFEESLIAVESITTNYYDLTKFSNDYNASIEVMGADNETIYTGAVLKSGYSLVILNTLVEETLTKGVLTSTNQSSTYTIVNSQEEILTNIVEEKEITSMTDVNGDGILSILDATHPTYIVVDKIETEEVLTNELTSSNTEVLVNDTVEVKLFVKGFDKLSLYGIEGLVSYDKNVLELVSYDVYQATEGENTLGDLNLENGKFAYVLNDGFNNEGEAILTLTFKAIAEGTSEVTVNNIINSYGENAFEGSVNTTINVDAPEDNKGGDEEDTTEDTTTEEEENTDTTEEVEEVTEPVVRPVVLSSDYYIKNLSITGYEIDFDMHTFEYSIKVGSDVTSLDLEVLLNHNNSIYYVEGNENFETGENLVYVVVKAENGSTKTYTIKVEKEKEVVKEDKTELDEEELEEDEEENSTSKTVIIILIILVIIGLIYVIFKDDEEDNKPTEKKQEPEKPRVEKVKVEKVKTDSPKQTKQPKKTTNSANNSKNKTTKKTNKK